MPLPEFIPPMLAKLGEPFDSDEHLFEIKWDGTRAMAFVSGDGYHMRNRRKVDMTPKYPEFSLLEDLPPGTVLDGEVVVLDEQGRAIFNKLQVRDQARNELKFRTLSQTSRATFIVFDQLYDNFQSIMDLPLLQRRERLQETITNTDDRIVFSEGIVGRGSDFFQQAKQRDIEGVMAKRLNGRYLPGKRVDSWQKIKKQDSMLCVIIGYLPKPGDFESLAIASEIDGQLTYVGKVGNGFDHNYRMKLLEMLERMHISKPVVSNKLKTAQWVEPKLFCFVRYLEMTKNQELRDPVFLRLVEG